MPHPSRPSLALLGLEPIRALLDLARLQLEHHDAASGDGHAVVLFPGLGTDRVSMRPLARHCEQLGYATLDWGRGFNAGPQGDAARWLDDLVDDVDAMTRAHRAGITLIGWSLGGLYAREIAKAIPAHVRQVITLGTPTANIGDATHASWLFKLLSGTSPDVSSAYARRLRALPPVPTTSIYSRSDGIVAWRACRIPRAPHAQNIEVRSSHLGLVWNAQVMRIVADRLAQAPGDWKPWRDPALPLAA
jgi:pimeloyl-ACP methyl ester carboxylesterase